MSAASPSSTVKEFGRSGDEDDDVLYQKLEDLNIGNDDGNADSAPQYGGGINSTRTYLDPNERHTFVVTELWKPSRQSLKKFFKAMKKNPDRAYTTTQVESILNGYISRNKLAIGGRDGTIIQLDDFLRYIAFPWTGSKRVQGQGTMTRNSLYNRVISRMEAWHVLEIDGVKREDRSEKLEPISVSLSGKKLNVLTVIKGFSTFEISPDAMANSLRSRGINVIEHDSTSLKIVAEGNCCKLSSDFLHQMGVPKKWIKVTKTKKSKD